MFKEGKTEDFIVFIKRLIVGLHGVYFRDVIKATSDCDILKVEGASLEAIKKIRESLNDSLTSISNSVKKNYKGRANELSNYLEGVLRNHINDNLNDFRASIPSTGNKKQSAGYPDLAIQFDKDCFVYVEVKIYQKKTVDSSLRSFYFTPSENNKISKSCSHILIGFEVESLGEHNRSPFIIKDFKIMDLYNLKVNLKPEFNANNPDIYENCVEIK